MNQNNKESNLSGVDRLDSLAGVTRREFLGMTAATLLVGGDLSDDTKSVKKNGIPYRPLGHTGESVSLVGLCGYHLGKQSDPEEGVRIIRTGLDEGINFLDNCWDYNGESELASASQHGFLFDSVQMPLNVMDPHFDSFEKKVLRVLVRNNIGVLVMKPMGDHFVLDSKTATAMECLHYSMNLPTSVVITGCDSLPILQQALLAARTFQSMQPSQVSALLAKTAKAAEAGKFELYKTSHHFDGTYANPQWLG